MARNLCLFAHYDANNRIEPYVLRYVEAIRSCGFDVVFISAAAIPDSEIATLTHLCRDVIRRPNRGLDFGSWAMGYAKHGRNVDGELLLANDSVYGPIGKLSTALTHLRALPGDFRGMVESLEYERHIQSWFILLSPKAYHSTSFQEILAQDFSKFSKKEVIAKGEIELSSRLRAAGLKSAALFSMAHRAFDGPIVRYNPTHVLWRELIELFDVPFIKVELLRDNPYPISNLAQWRTVLNARAPELVSMVEMHLSRSTHNYPGDERTTHPFSALTREAFVRRDLQLDRSDKRIKRELNKYIYEYTRAIIKGIRCILGTLNR